MALYLRSNQALRRRLLQCAAPLQEIKEMMMKKLLTVAVLGLSALSFNVAMAHGGATPAKKAITVRFTVK